MKASLIIIGILCNIAGLAQPYELAAPLLRYPSIFIENETKLSMAFDMQGASIRYTLNGDEPNEKSNKYQSPIVLHQHKTVVKAKAFAKGYKPSATVTQTFYPTGHRINSITTSKPNEKYNGLPKLLTDNLSGGSNHSNGSWLGYNSDSVVLEVSQSSPQQLSVVMLHVLLNQPAWIFAPEKIRIYNQQQQCIAEKTIAVEQQQTAVAEGIEVSIPTAIHQQIRIVIYPLQQLPEWHDGKGQKAWFFIDEIKLY